MLKPKPTAAPRLGRRRRFAMSLLELLAVVTLMGVFASVAVTRLGRDIFGDTGVRSEARKLSLGILEAQRGAIKSGEAHGIQFGGSQSKVVNWAVYRVKDDGSREIIDGPHLVPEDYTVSVDSTDIEFDFEGNGTSGLQIDLQGPHRNWRLSVLPLTRMIDSQEVD